MYEFHENLYEHSFNVFQQARVSLPMLFSRTTVVVCRSLLALVPICETLFISVQEF